MWEKNNDLATSSAYDRLEFLSGGDGGRDLRVVPLDRYSPDELATVISDYKRSGIAIDALSPMETAYVSAITSRRPKEVFRYIATFI